MTPLELKTLDYVREEIAGTGIAPSVREIARRVGSGVNSAHSALTRLVEAGYLIRRPHRERGLSLADTVDLRGVPTDLMRAELGRRGETFDSIATYERRAFGKAVSCAADSCQIEVKRGMLFCRRHWFSLPQSLQQDIKRAYSAKDTSKYQVFVSEARDRIDRAESADAPRQGL